MRGLWRIFLPLVLTGFLVPDAVSSFTGLPIDTGLHAETRVGGLGLGSPYPIRTERVVTLGTHQGYAPAYDVIASGSLLAARGAGDWAKLSGMLRDAARGKGNFGIGTATREQARAMGEAWVGPGFRTASDGTTLISADGLRQFRPPSFKPTLDRFQANFEARLPGLTQWQSNAHLDILGQ